MKKTQEEKVINFRDLFVLFSINTAILATLYTGFQSGSLLAVLFLINGLAISRVIINQIRIKRG